MDVTPRKCAKVLALHQHTKKSQRKIAKCVGVSQPTVHRLIKKFQIEDLTPNRKGNSFIHSFIFILLILIKVVESQEKVDAGKHQTLKHARRRHKKK